MNINYRVLIVEDEPNVRLVFRTALESNSYEVTSASDGEAALACLARERFDIVLLDLQMPGTCGMEVLERLRERDDDTPVVIVSAHDRAQNVVQAMRLGAIDFLPKPVTPDLLRQKVAEVLVRADATDPDDAKLGHSVERTRSTLGSAKRALNHRLFHRAAILLTEAIKEEPHSAEPRYLLGVLREVEGKAKAAADAYRDALRVEPGFEPARFHLMKFAEQPAR
jgi:DNA-binding NtrC family response regulator